MRNISTKIVLLAICLQVLLQVGVIVEAARMPAWARVSGYVLGGYVLPVMLALAGMGILVLYRLSATRADVLRLLIVIYELLLLGLGRIGPQGVSGVFVGVLVLLTIPVVVLRGSRTRSGSASDPL